MTTDFDRWNHHRFKHSKDGPGRDHSNAPSRPGRSSISPLPADPGRMQPGPSPSRTAQPPRNVSGLYHELLYAVARKFPFESRHETALRYIREAEERAENRTWS